MNYSEKSIRTYYNGVTIVYELLDSENLYIHSLNSRVKQVGNATISLNAFLEEFFDFNIYLFATSDLGTDQEILDHWYRKLGFIEVENSHYIPYNISHEKRKM